LFAFCVPGAVQEVDDHEDIERADEAISIDIEVGSDAGG
jgi:hypothetical protein